MLINVGVELSNWNKHQRDYQVVFPHPEIQKTFLKINEIRKTINQTINRSN